jgi:hypothetical protein
MVHPIYTVSQVTVELERCIVTSTVLEAASGVIAMLTVSLTGQPMKCGSTMRVQPDLGAVHRSTRSSIRLCVNIFTLAHTGNVLRSSLVARPLRLCREPADDVRRIRQPVRRNK